MDSWGQNEDLYCRDTRQTKGICDRCDCSWQGSPRGGAGGYDQIIREYKPYILESFFYADADTERLLPHYGDFLLDSGAFTFMQGKGGSPDWNEYVERYADFIKRNNVKKFFELDIDSVVGYERVKQIRAALERLTGRQSIPVWHLSRGTEEFRRMCDEYNYVAIGGIVSGEIAKEYYRYFPNVIDEAHKRNAKIHGLGFTNLALLPQMHFDSVDSTAWTTGNRFGYLYYFDGKTMKKREAPKGHRIADSRMAAINNYVEWIKYQKYAELHFKKVRKPHEKNRKKFSYTYFAVCYFPAYRKHNQQ